MRSPAERVNLATRRARRAAASRQGRTVAVWEAALIAEGERAAARLPIMAAAEWSEPDADEVAGARDAMRRRLEAATEAERLDTLTIIVSGVLAEFGIAFDLRNPIVEGVLEQLGQNIVDVTETTRRDIMLALDEAWREGLSVPDAARRVAERARSIAGQRAYVIARTELAAAVNGGSLAAVRILNASARRSGEPLIAPYKTWLSSLDSRTRKTHRAASSQVVPVEEPFSVGGYALRYPGDPAGPGEEVIQCRCTVAYADTSSGLPGVPTPEQIDEAAASPTVQAQDDRKLARQRSAKRSLARVATIGEQMPGRRRLTRTELVAQAQASAALRAIDAEQRARAINVSSAANGGRLLGDEPSSSGVWSKPGGATRVSVTASGVAVVNDPVTEPVELDDAADVEAVGQRWRALLALEGSQTSDGRLIDAGALRFRALPLTLMSQVETQPGHDGAQIAGRIESVERVDAGDGVYEWWAEGTFDSGPWGVETARLVGEGTLTGVSIDLAVHAVEYREPEVEGDEPQTKEEIEAEVIEELFGMPDVIEAVTDGEVLGATVTPFPAFAEASIALAASGARVGMASDSRGFLAVGTITLAPNPFPPAGEGDAPADDDAPEDDEAQTVRDAAASLADAHPGLDGSISVTIDGKESNYPFPDAAEPDGEGESITASAAGLAPVAPPAEWYTVPEPDELVPFTVRDDGHVYGHIAAWGQCHIGLPGSCTTAPPSGSDYSLFHLGEVVCDDGSIVNVGTITMGTGHASLSDSAHDALAHYDNTGTAAAHVRAVDGTFGIWVCGALDPELDVAQVRRLRAAKPSGDWRSVQGAFEMVGVLAVNVPGFPVVRARAVVAAGEVRALIAAGRLPETAQGRREMSAAMMTPAEVQRRADSLLALVAPELAIRRVAERAL